ncbi:sugar ABC transporter permease, partial [Candidatus Poribacteria bacterium]|nr:sugar ABC transporter permease [Candidatus Poribacteria bacterium]
MKRSTRINLTGYAFITPWLMAMIFLIGYPFAASLYFSTCEYPPLRGPIFIGLGNYQELARDAVFRESMLVTIVFAVVSIPLGVLLALTLALFLNSRIHGRSIYRVVYYLPHLVPSVAVAILWMWMFNPQFGILNVLLSPFGRIFSVLLRPLSVIKFTIPGWTGLILVILTFILWRWLKRFSSPLSQIKMGFFSQWSEKRLKFVSFMAGLAFFVCLIFALAIWINPVDLEKIKSPGWLTDANPFPSGLSVSPSWALWALIYMSLWGVGQMAIIYLAKLQDVPIVLYEVADLDGANWWQKTRYITLPMISPVILFNV